MFGQLPGFAPGLIRGVVVPGVVLGAGVFGFVVVWPFAASATPPPMLNAAATAATGNVRTRTKPNLLSPPTAIKQKGAGRNRRVP
jgi:hypothetical protein